MVLEDLFWARRVAVVGASSTEGKTGHTILRNLVEGGFAGEVYPVNPRGGQILGHKVYLSLADLPGDVDLVVVVVPALSVPGVLEQAAARHARGAVVISGGFREAGNQELEDALLAAARAGGIRVIGPNCQGLNYTPNRLCASWPLITTPGSLAVISQSGTIGAAVAGWAAEEGVGISAFISLGNRCDVNEVELIRFFAGDDRTRVIALYVEGIADGPGFVQVAREVGRRKPLVVLKPGRTEKGVRAAQSHTRSLAGSYEVFRGIARQVRAVLAEDTEQLYDFAKAFALAERPPGRRLVIVTSSGGSGIMATDQAELAGLEVMELDPDLKARLREALPAHCVISNPLDLTGDADAERYRVAVGVASASGADVFLLVFGDPIPGAAEVVEQLRQTVRQQVFVSYLGGGQVQAHEVARMLRAGIPVYSTPERAVRAIGAWWHWGRPGVKEGQSIA